MTIKEIARLAEVSTSTVSRVLNDSGYVKQEVRERVEKIIDDTGYLPSDTAKDLKKKNTKLIGVIIPKLSSRTIGLVADGITKVLDENGYSSILANTGLDFKKEIEFIKIFKQKRVDGIIFVATNIAEEHVKLLKKMKIPTVFIGQDSSSHDFSCIIHNDYGATVEMTNYLVKNGHLKIGFIGVDEIDRAVGYQRRRGYEDALKEHGIDVDRNLISIGNFEISSVDASMRKLMKEKPTAILAVTDNLAVGAINYLLKNGYRVPEDVSVVGEGDSGIAEIYNPGLTTIKYQYLESGEESARVLMRILKTDKSEKIVMNYRLVERESASKI
ncbi:LacI family DNA-binding transcriptional regulator [uncultured Ilyobacter sp.]|jgi:LacI family sucrose operon transcriptional repressor|uniref:LacI family DNA-binding transcriptional regulator n=1 Tax=uncultured Ilyobacter sp. TaxID=544433 RepID=UPI0029C08591|nr:LacI family DNA-binding transcriptional regulator [uncultured Ilyobacter sp.]